MMKNLRYLLLVAALFCMDAINAQINFVDDFESYVYPPDGSSNIGGGWTVLGNVFFIFGDLDYAYGPLDAPNGTGGFSSTESDGGNIVFNVFSDYNVGHGLARRVESLIFQETILGPGDLGLEYIFMFDHRLPPNGNTDINNPNLFELSAFIKVLDPNNGLATVYFDTFDTSADAEWTTSSLNITIDAAWDGHIIQWGFLNRSTLFAPTEVWYDNVSFALPPPPVVEGIPTMGEWGLICLSIMLLIFGVVSLRQKNFAF